MKVMGIILILLGLAIIVFQGIRMTDRDKSLDVGPVEITKQVRGDDGWQLYAAGGVAIVVGLVLTLAGRRKLHVQ